MKELIKTIDFFLWINIYIIKKEYYNYKLSIEY
jgi:hypothetical protein